MIRRDTITVQSTIWAGRRTVVTGGASFIGSHLAEALVARGAEVRIVDDLSSGRLENIEHLVREGAVDLIEADLREPGIAARAVEGAEIVFHLAADHGGRGYVDTRQAGPASNLLLDGLVIWESVRAGVEKVVFASSGCVYPNYLQTDPSAEVFLHEDVVSPPYDADNMYGWAKLMTELALQAYHREQGLKAVSCRYFTVYGPRCNENHAVIAMIAKAFAGQDPFEVWGTGEQIRNWTHVEDIVTGTLAATERIDDGTPVNLGTMERIRVLDAARMVLELTGHRAEIVTRPDLPTGPLNRVADNGRARQLLGWEPQVAFAKGLRRTVDWYVSTRDPEEVRRILADGGLIERKAAVSAL